MYEINITVAEKVKPYDELLDNLETVSRDTNDYLEESAALLYEIGKARYKVILEQLKPIIDGGARLYKIMKANNHLNGAFKLVASYTDNFYHHCHFVIEFYQRPDEDTVRYMIEYGNNLGFLKDFLKCDVKAESSENGILTDWNEYNIIEKLDKHLKGVIKVESDAQSIRVENRRKALGLIDK